MGLKDERPLRLGSVILEAGGADASGARLAVEGGEVGFVTQAVVSPYLGGKTLGLAKLRRPFNAAGTRVEATIEGGSVAGEVVRHPVYDPERRGRRSSPDDRSRPGAAPRRSGDAYQSAPTPPAINADTM